MPKYEPFTVPENVGRQAVLKRYASSSKGRTRDTRRNSRRNDESESHYLSRPFVAWDGEGVNNPDGTHAYVTLANSRGNRIEAPPPKGLSTYEIFEFLLDESTASGDVIHVVFGGSYDTNMFLKSFDESQLRKIRVKKHAWVGDYCISWRPGKSFWLKHRDGRKIMLYDVASFFQTSFVNACDGYLGNDWHQRDMIVREKARRGTFTYEELSSVNSYNDAELINLVRLMNELRSRLHGAGLRVRRWDGPGAIAASLLTKYRVKDHMNRDIPEPVARAARVAYAGGRFEILKYGHVARPVYEYDLKSAYPSALRYVPCLAHGVWTHHEGDPGDRPYGLYHVAWDHITRGDQPGPFVVRYENGTVAFPDWGQTWTWNPEVPNARELHARNGGSFEVLEAWIYTQTCDHHPFGFVEPLFAKRQEMIREGNGAQVGIKLGLNSLYGKLAQQVGWERLPDGTLRIPHFHQLEWAGFVTSHCRSNVMRASMMNPSATVAFETDALFSLEPLPLKIGENLGDWELTTFDDLTYVQSGMYWGNVGKKSVSKTRGIDKCRCPKGEVCVCGALNRDVVLAAMRKEAETVNATLTRFVGAGVALTQSFDRWCNWEKGPREIKLYPSGKRVHSIHVDNENGCFGRLSRGEENEYHSTDCMLWGSNIGVEYPVEWVNPNPNMTVDDEGTTFAEAREFRPTEYD